LVLIVPKLDNLPNMLARIEPGFLPGPLFDAVARLVVTPTFVVVPLFRRGEQIRALLTRRDAHDVHYAGLLHPPGKIILTTDTSLDDVFRRLIASELSHVPGVSGPEFVAPFFDMIFRGREISLVHYVTIPDPGDSLETFDCADLPRDIIQTDIPRILAAAALYGQNNPR